MTAEEKLQEVLNLSDECISRVRLEIRGERAWGEAEKAADEDIKTGKIRRFNSVEELIEDLHRPNS